MRYDLGMCGRYEVHSPVARITRAFGIRDSGVQFEPRYNIAPTQTAPIVVNRGAGNHLELARWGLIPGWARDPGVGSRMINARADTLTEKRTYKGLLDTSRCLAVADGFYEWRKEGRRKVPMYVRLRDGWPFGFAALYSTWRNPEDGDITTFTIVTTGANELLRGIHDRMPVILRREDERRWLDPGVNFDEGLAELLRPYPAGEMECYEVSPLVNKPANDSPENIRRVG